MAMQSQDYEAASKLVNESIKYLLNTRLSKNQLSILATMKDEHGEMMSNLLSEAFRKGWAREGESKLSTAMDDVLQAAQTMVQAYRMLNEGMSTRRVGLAKLSTHLR